MVQTGEKTVGAKIQGRTVVEHKDNLGRKQTQKGKTCWSRNKDGHGQNNRESLDDMNDRKTGWTVEQTRTRWSVETQEGLDWKNMETRK